MKDKNMHARVDAILNFWFGDSPAADAVPAEKAALWSGEGLEEAVNASFIKDVDRAARGKLSSWEKAPRTSLALILALDRFSGHAVLDPPAEGLDEKAQDLVLWGIEQGYDQGLKPLERWFYYLPLTTAEDPDLQKIASDAYARLDGELPAGIKNTLASLNLKKN